MDQLPRIIGPAPSELSLGAFINMRLKPERERVQRSLEAFRLGAVPSWSKKPPKEKKKAPSKRTKLSAKRLDALLGEHNITISEIQRITEELLNEHKQQRS